MSWRGTKCLQVLLNKLGDNGSSILGKVTVKVVKGGDAIKIGRRSLQCISARTPRYPELMCLYERNTRRLFSSCFFSAHVNPQRGVMGTDGMDTGGWAKYGSDWQYFFDCMFAPVASQAASAVEKLDLAVAGGTSTTPPLLLQLRQFFGMAPTERKGSRPVAVILPRHGPIIKQSVTQLVNEYDKCDFR
jgi:flavorubredoxin